MRLPPLDTPLLDDALSLLEAVVPEDAPPIPPAPAVPPDEPDDVAEGTCSSGAQAGLIAASDITVKDKAMKCLDIARGYAGACGA